MSENNLFPRKQDIFQKSTKDLQTVVGRPSIDTQFQVLFSFGNYQSWLRDIGGDIARARTAGLDFKQKMSIMCTEAELPGTSFEISTATGHHQGIVEEFPNLRNFPPLNLTFYVDADHVILEVFETWMTFINPIKNNKRNFNAYSRFSYPEDYKEILHITKFERDAFTDKSSKISSYEFVNVWPTNMTSMRVAYGDSNVLRCNLELAYDRFITSFNYKDTQKTVLNSSSGVVNSNDIVSVTQKRESQGNSGFYREENFSRNP